MFESFITACLPTRFSTQEATHRAEAKKFVLVWLITITTTIVLLYLFDRTHFLWGFFVCIIALPVFIVILLLFEIRPSLRFITTLFVSTLLLMISVLILGVGTLDYMTASWFMLPPITARSLLGKKAGLLWSARSVLMGCITATVLYGGFCFCFGYVYQCGALHQALFWTTASILLLIAGGFIINLFSVKKQPIL